MPDEIQLISKELNPTKEDLLHEEISGDIDINMFLNEWLNNGLNATQAYLKLHPEVSSISARTLGSRKLAKVNLLALLAGYQLGIDLFFEKLKEGLNAQKTDENGQEVPDYKARFAYQQLHGRLLGLL